MKRIYRTIAYTLAGSPALMVFCDNNAMVALAGFAYIIAVAAFLKHTSVGRRISADIAAMTR